jgi:hypothetical protein
MFVMADLYRENFAALCKSIRDGNATMLECRNIESGALMVAICSTKQLAEGQMEFIPLARLVDHAYGSLILPSFPDGIVRAWKIT